MARKKRFSGAVCALLCVVCLIVGAVIGGYLALALGYHPQSGTVLAVPGSGVEVHFPMLGSWYTGDCTYIKAGDNDILIDAGANTKSIPAIAAYLEEEVEDGVLEYVIVTHAHEDHYAGFATSENEESLFDLFSVEVIIDFALTNQKDDARMYSNYCRERQEAIDRGAVHYTAAQCREDASLHSFDLGGGAELEILDSYYYYNKASTENDYSVCCLLSWQDEYFLFTGDLEEEGETYLTQLNSLPQVTLYKAGHHGSKTSSHDVMLEQIRPEYVAVCCCCGSDEYTKTAANQFPTQDFIDRIAPYTDQVYVTTISTDNENKQYAPMNGNLVFTTGNGGLTVSCSASQVPLRESEWFRNNRTCPAAWKS